MIIRLPSSRRIEFARESAEHKNLSVSAYNDRLIVNAEILFQRSLPLNDDAAMPLVSVVTQTLNSERTIAQAIESVRTQTYPNIEHIIVDGKSADGTMDIVLAARNHLGQVVRGADTSPADAANKGFAIARGRYISVLPSDDFMPNDYVENCVAALTRTGADYVFGDLIYLREGEPALLVPGDAEYSRHIHYVMPNVSSTTMMHRRECFKDVGLLDVSNPYCPDYDWVLRAHKAGLKGSYDSAIRIFFRYGGVSTANYYAALAWTRNVAICHGTSPFLAYWGQWRGVIRKKVRDMLQKSLPPALFYPLLRALTRTGSLRFEEHTASKTNKDQS